MDDLLLLRPRHERRKMKRFFLDMAKQTPKQQCQFPQTPACAGKIIDSHSIQRAGTLKSLCDNSNHVVRLQQDITFDRPPKAVPKLVGINKASVFYALCAKHDHELFMPIENSPLDPDNTTHLFLIAYRGFLHDYYGKFREVVLNRKVRDFLVSDRTASQQALDFEIKISRETQHGLDRLVSRSLNKVCG